MSIPADAMFGRRLRLQAGDVVFDAPFVGPLRGGETRTEAILGDPDALRVSFKVRKKIPVKATATPSAEPPGLALRVYNLSPETRARVQALVGTKQRGVALDAGYGDDVGGIFRGEMAAVRSWIEGTEWITEIIGKSGHGAGQTTISDTLPPGATKLARVQKLIDTLARENPGLSFKHAIDRIKSADAHGALDELANGVTMTGRALDQFRVLSKDIGMEAFVDDNDVFALYETEVRGDRRVVLSPYTGLISAPTPIVDTARPDKLVIRVTSLLQWRLALAGVVEMESTDYAGFFRVRALVHTGDTHEAEYSSEIEAEAVEIAYDPILKETLSSESVFAGPTRTSRAEEF